MVGRIILVFVLGLTFQGKAKADMFGGDTLDLTQILSNAISQLYELYKVVETTQDTLDLMKEINRGVHKTLQLSENVIRPANPGLYGEWENIQQARQNLENIYGKVANSKEAVIQRDMDQLVAEAVSLNNDLHQYSQNVSQIAAEIKTHSGVVSQVGAQKLTAQGIGVMVEVMGESLKTQASALKLEAQEAAVQNHREKESTRSFLDNSNALSDGLKGQRATFQTPRF
jgi:hypothetical protein